MYTGRIIFSQLFDFLTRYEFNKCVNRYQGNRRVRNFSCLNQFLCMAFAQLTGRESLRDIETCLRAMEEKLYHAGFRGKISRGTLADVNSKRDWRIFRDFAHLKHPFPPIMYGYYGRFDLRVGHFSSVVWVSFIAVGTTD